MRLRSADEATEYFNDADLDAAAKELSSQDRGRIRDLFVPGMRKRTISLAIVAFLAWGAQLSFVMLMPIILVSRGNSISDSLTLTMVQNLGGLFGAILTTVGAYYVRRKVMMLSGSLMAGATIILFGLFAETPAMIMLLGFLFNFAVMIVNTTVWTWAPELFPTKIRALGTAVVVNIGFIGGALLPLVAAWMVDHGSQPATIVMIVILYIGILLVSRLVTETHNKSFEELDIV